MAADIGYVCECGHRFHKGDKYCAMCTRPKKPVRFALAVERKEEPHNRNPLHFGSAAITPRHPEVFTKCGVDQTSEHRHPRERAALFAVRALAFDSPLPKGLPFLVLPLPPNRLSNFRLVMEVNPKKVQNFGKPGELRLDVNQPISLVMDTTRGSRTYEITQRSVLKRHVVDLLVPHCSVHVSFSGSSFPLMQLQESLIKSTMERGRKRISRELLGGAIYEPINSDNERLLAEVRDEQHVLVIHDDRWITLVPVEKFNICTISR
jgi:hypothetical protein